MTSPADHHTQQSPPAPPSATSHFDLWVLLITLVYGSLHLLWYWQTPLGQAPVLDEQENLDLAWQIASGSLPAEPFYRAMGYPLFLAVFPLAGVPMSLMPFIATAAGLAMHIVNTLLIMRIARRIFTSEGAALIAGLLHGANPVLIHYATQTLDGTLANTALLLGLHLMVLRSRNHPLLSWAGAALCWSAAALIRPQLLLVSLTFPLIVWLLHSPEERSLRGVFRLVIPAGIAGLLPWLALGLSQQKISGEFRLMPTQGAYNPWAANKPGAHGKYFAQLVHIPGEKSHRNPTRVESELLYARETGLAASDLDVVNAYWNHRLVHSFLSDPTGLAARLLRKTYFLVNNAEQYNNKTYAFHKSRSPWLRFNPVGWGIVLLSGIVGMTVMAVRDRRCLLALLITGAALAVSTVLTFVSARFRLPLIAILCLSSGGLALFPVQWRSWHRRRQLAWLCGFAALGILTFSTLAGVQSRETWIQDQVLIASAAVRTGDDEEAWRQASSALHTNPSHRESLAWCVASYYNLLLVRAPLPAPETDWLDVSRRFVRQNATAAPETPTLLAGIAEWRNGSKSTAVSIWERCADHPATEAEALALLSLTDLSATTTYQRLAILSHSMNSPPALVQMAIAGRSSSQDETTRFWRGLAQYLFTAPTDFTPVSTP